MVIRGSFVMVGDAPLCQDCADRGTDACAICRLAVRPLDPGALWGDMCLAAGWCAVGILVYCICSKRGAGGGGWEQLFRKTSSKPHSSLIFPVFSLFDFRGVAVAIGDSKVHATCFTCMTCAASLVGAEAFPSATSALAFRCRPCAESNRPAAIACIACGEPIVGTASKLKTGLYHQACIACCEPGCSTELTGGYFPKVGTVCVCVCLSVCLSVCVSVCVCALPRP